MSEPGPLADGIQLLHDAVDREARHLVVLHADRLQCRRGCSGCCIDGLTVFEVVAEHIRRRHQALLAAGVAHGEGACAFLDAAGACRIYDDRPYVCRTQGLPLRWIDGDETDGTAETRDICPLNDAGAPIETLPIEHCWTLGPTEESLARLQLAFGSGHSRIRLRDLFAASSDGLVGDNSPSSPHSTTKG